MWRGDGGEKGLVATTPIASSQFFGSAVLLRESREVDVKFYSLRTEFFVCFSSQNFYSKCIFTEMASFALFIVKLSQWIKLSPNDIMAKMFLLSFVSNNYDIICKYVPDTKK